MLSQLQYEREVKNWMEFVIVKAPGLLIIDKLMNETF